MGSFDDFEDFKDCDDFDDSIDCVHFELDNTIFCDTDLRLPHCRKTQKLADITCLDCLRKIKFPVHINRIPHSLIRELCREGATKEFARVFGSENLGSIEIAIHIDP